MNNRFSLLFVFLFSSIMINVNAQQQLPNAGFENWTQYATYTQPDQWKTLDSSTTLLGVTFTSKETSPHSGASAIKLQSKEVNVLFTKIPAPGLATLGKISISIGSTPPAKISGGIPFTGRPIKLKGYYKYAPVTGDSAFIGIILQKRNVKNPSKTDTIGGGAIKLSSPVSVFTPFELNIYYPVNDLPDTLNVLLASSNPFSPKPGSILTIDDLLLEYDLTSVNEQKTNETNFVIFPNPVTSEATVSVDFKDVQPTCLTVYNIIGEKVYETPLENISKKTYQINMSGLVSGSYLFVVTHGDQVVKSNSVIKK